MKEGWKVRKLEEVCLRITDGSHNPPKGVEFSDFLMLSSKNITDGKITFNNPRYLKEKDFDYENKRTDVSFGDVLLTIVGTIGRTAVVPKLREKITLQRSVAVLKPNEKFISPYFLKLALDNNVAVLEKEARGVAQKGIYLSQVKNISIFVPPLSEQQRIVETLDKAFAKIDIIRQNAERNLINAKELFQNALTKELNQKESWSIDKLSNCFKLTSGEYLSSDMICNGKYPVYGGNGITGMHNQYNLSGRNIIIGRVGALCGNARCIEENIWLTDNGFKITGFNYKFDLQFLTYQLNHIKLRKYARQTAQPVISNSSLKDITILIPPLSEQQQIVSKLNALSEQCKQLENNYLQTIDDCDELKKAILAKAFNGEL